MGFALWVEDHAAWAQGTHEYRPMGAAIVAAGSRFTPRDFRPRRQAPGRSHPRFVGLFASLGEMNHWLAAHSTRPARSQHLKIVFRRRSTVVFPEF